MQITITKKRLGKGGESGGMNPEPCELWLAVGCSGTAYLGRRASIICNDDNNNNTDDDNNNNNNNNNVNSNNDDTTNNDNANAINIF